MLLTCYLIMPRFTPSGGARLVTVDRAGAWLIRELGAPSVDGPSRHLQMTGDGLVRVVRNYPPDWFEWSDEDLFKLFHESRAGDDAEA